MWVCLRGVPPAIEHRSLTLDADSLRGAGRLRVLSLASSNPLRILDGAFRAHRTALTRLAFYECGLPCVPPALSDLADSLAELHIRQDSELQLSAECEATIVSLRRLRRLSLIKPRLHEVVLTQENQARTLTAAADLEPISEFEPSQLTQDQSHLYMHVKLLDSPTRTLILPTRLSQAAVDELRYSPALWSPASLQRLVMLPSAFMLANGVALCLKVSHTAEDAHGEKCDADQEEPEW